MSDIKDIWLDNGGAEGLSEEQLMAYLEGRLPEEERHAVEEWLSRDGMESDALEGLQSLNAEETRTMQKRLDMSLQKALGKKHRSRRGISEQKWTWIAIVIILLLAIAGYAIVYLAKHPLR